ncbi:MAG: hypothetical protein MUO76_19925 [Anaerolineaceae bacterium]|nr:hypothetical protein [Anaerolineaceae bacterium]
MKKNNSSTVAAVFRLEGVSNFIAIKSSKWVIDPLEVKHAGWDWRLMNVREWVGNFTLQAKQEARQAKTRQIPS